MNWTLGFPVQPGHDALLVELAKTLEPGELVSWIILDHADRTFLRIPILAEAVLL